MFLWSRKYYYLHLIRNAQYFVLPWYFVEERNGVPPPEKIEFGKEVKEDLNSNPEDDPTHFIAILVESLYMLRKIPEAAEVGIDL